MEFLTMSRKELERHHIITLVQEHRMSQVKAAELLQITDRQVRNLLKTFQQNGPEGLISKKRNCPSNRAINPDLKRKIMKIISDKYSDFSPTFAAEKLEENHRVKISHETLRRWMTEIHLWIPKQKRIKKHFLRKRKEYFGEMIQADGSHEAWFEDRNSCCVLIVFIDDATSKLTALRFCETECLEGYFSTLREHLLKYGKPISLYTDRFSVFESGTRKENVTQFKRALNALGIRWIGANSPQAKGRVERCNRTLQDRLIKEMRLRKISTIAKANEYLEEFMEKYNQKFSKKPMRIENLHRPLEREIDLTRALSKYEERTLTKDLVFQHHGKHFKITDQTLKCFKGQKIEIRSGDGKDINVYIGKRKVDFKSLNFVFDSPKEDLHWEPREDWHQSETHPWKKHSVFLKNRKAEIQKYENEYNNKTGNF